MLKKQEQQLDAAFQIKYQAAETAKAFRRRLTATRDVRRELEMLLEGEIKKRMFWRKEIAW